MPRTGRRRGMPDTRGQILQAAAAQFGASGYEATTVRKVAADAGVDPALIRRFFGNKEGLFTQVAASVLRPDEAIAALLQGPRRRLGERLARYFLGLLGDVHRPGPALSLIRPAVTSEHAAALMRRFLATEVLARIAAALGADHAELRAALAASQVVGLAVARAAVGLEPLVAAPEEELVAWVAPTLQRYFTGKAPTKAAGLVEGGAA
jgi:AcrR family transcriptional regulator